LNSFSKKGKKYNENFEKKSNVFLPFFTFHLLALKKICFNESLSFNFLDQWSLQRMFFDDPIRISCFHLFPFFLGSRRWRVWACGAAAAVVGRVFNCEDVQNTKHLECRNHSKNNFIIFKNLFHRRCGNNVKMWLFGFSKKKKKKKKIIKNN